MYYPREANNRKGWVRDTKCLFAGYIALLPSSAVGLNKHSVNVLSIALLKQCFAIWVTMCISLRFIALVAEHKYNCDHPLYVGIFKGEMVSFKESPLF